MLLHGTAGVGCSSSRKPLETTHVCCLQVWRQNTEAERLLGVSMTGVMDNTLTSGKQGQVRWRAEAAGTE